MPLQGEFVLSPEKQPKTLVTPEGQPVIKGRTPGLFTSFCRHPQGLSFRGQKENEEIVLLLRRHFIVNYYWIALVLFLIIVPFLLPLFHISNFLSFLSLNTSTELALSFFYYLIIFAIVLVNFSLWYFNVGLVTTLRVIDMDIHNILFLDVSEVFVNLIKDVSFSQKGALAGLLNFGDVDIQTEVTVQNVEYDRIPRPNEVAQIITDLQEGVERV